MISKDKTKVEYSIDADSYEQIVNNIKDMAPLEIGVEVAVYMLLYGVIDSKKYCLLDTNTMPKRKALIYANQQGKAKAENEVKSGVKNEPKVDKTADLVIVGKNFAYNDGVVNEDKNSEAYCLIEVKYFSEKNSGEEFEVQKEYTNHFVWTNGLNWKIWNKNEKTEFDLIEKAKYVREPYKIIKNKFNELIQFLGTIKWEE